MNDQNNSRVLLAWLSANVVLSFGKGLEQPFMGWRSTYEGELHPITTIQACLQNCGIREKIACIVLLLEDDESFADIQISNVNFYKQATAFELRRKRSNTQYRVEF